MAPWTQFSATGFSSARVARLRPGTSRLNAVGYAPVLDTERGVVAGVAAIPARGRTLSAEQLASVLSHAGARPRNTFLSVPLTWASLEDAAVRAELLRPADLSGIVFELVAVQPGACTPVSRAAASAIQDAGGLLALQADEIWHPDFEAVTDRSPKMIVVGARWVRAIDQSERRQSILETLGQVAAQRDAWLLAEGVTTCAELRALVGLGVPLVRGDVVGRADFTSWPTLAAGVTAVLGPQRPRPPGPMRHLLQVVPTAFTPGDAVAAVLRGSREPGVAVTLDRYARPTGLALLTVGGVRVTEDILCVHVDTPLADAAARAKARGLPSDPLVAVDSAGRFVGIVTAAALAAAAKPGDGPSAGDGS